ncbi:MAG: deoxyribonuclease V [Anaerolineales bacterium]|nr:deoxyribonuclease V [Chloroflexota bacterium]MBL6980085.1 deoxyribonuclease V [Anaerolineales bacterium]
MGLARRTHAWDLPPKDAIQLQEQLRTRVISSSLADESIQYVAGIDVGFPRNREIAHAAIVLLKYPSMELVDQGLAELPVSMPYVPGLLSFREIPVILAALEEITLTPDLLITDSQGIAHPRRFGLACHLGVLLDMPAIGCAKSILVGKHSTLRKMRGSTADLVDNGETIGSVVRTRDGVKPVYISIGHRVDLTSAVRIILNCGSGYRLPEPTRWAHKLASKKS